MSPMSPRKKILHQVHLEPEQLARLRFLSAVSRVPMNVYVREGLDWVLDKYEPAISAAEKVRP